MNTPSESENRRNVSQDYGTPIPTQDVIDLSSVDDHDMKQQQTDYGTPIPTREVGELTSLDEQTEGRQEVDSPKQPARKFQLLYKTLLNIECGPKMKKYPIHKELLCSHSETVNFLCEQAKVKVYEYKRADTLEQRMQRELEIASDDFRANLVVQMLSCCFESYPIPEYQAKIKQAMRDETNKLFIIHKYSKVAITAGGLPKKGGSAYPGDGLHETLDRVRLLKSEGIQHLAQVTYEHLLKVKSDRYRKANNDRAIAAAQGRLILADFSTTVVQFFVHWLYTEQLVFQNASQLCEIYGLAQELGVTRLSDHCKKEITDALFEQISKFEYGTLNESSLEAAIRVPSEHQASGIEIPDDPLLDIVYAMLAYVLKVREPPPVLRGLVINTLAFGGNEELLNNIAPKLAPKFVLGLCRVLYERAELAEAGYSRMSLGTTIQTRHEQKYQIRRATEPAEKFIPESSTGSLPVDLTIE